jgi:TonB family protein
MLQERGSGAGLRVRDRTDAFRSGIKMVRVMNTEVLTSFTGRTLDGRFPLLEWLGSVGQRGVFRTEFEGAQTQKAAIWLSPADAEDAQAEMEGWAASAGLSHPHLARLFAYGQCAIDGRELLYVVTELPEESLSEVLPVRPLTPAETGEMLTPVLDALSYLHGKGLVHGHLQPSNILVIGDQLKLSTDSLQCAGNSIKLTAAPQIYDAPETETWPISAAADVWSLGVTLVEALTQRTPAWDKSAGGDPVVPAQVPEPFAEIARRCLRQAPALRCTLKEIRALLDPSAVLPVAEVADAAVAVSQTEPSIPAEPQEPTPAEFEFDDALPSRRTLRSVEEAQEGGPSKHRTPLLIAAAFVVLVLIVALLMRGHKAQPASESETQTASTGEDGSSARAPGSHSSSAKGTVVNGRVAQRVMPDVPAPANRTIRGRVDVRIRVKVDRTGNVSDAQVDSAGGSRYFAKLAQDAARKWKFKPARVDGRAASSVWMLRFEFRKDGAEVTPVEVTP